MMQFLAAQTVVQVIGLAVVMAGNPGIDVVMPRIHTETVRTHSTQMAELKQARANVSARTLELAPAAPGNQPPVPAPLAPSHVAKHTAILAYRATDVQGPTTGWNVNVLPQVGGPTTPFRYVVLDGEHLRFLVTGNNPPATVPANLPRLSDDCADKNAPQLTPGRKIINKAALANRYTGVTTRYHPVLNPGYQPPGYPQATAVLHIPAGTTNACLATFNNTSNGRVDTRIVLDNNGTVVLQATKNGGTVRTLTFNGTSLNGQATVLMVANVPDAWLTNPSGYGPATETGHYHAYYSMLDTAITSNCSRQVTAAVPGPCNGNATFKTSSPPDVASAVVMSTWECSNSQYP